MAPSLEWYDDPRPFLAAAEEFLKADPVLSTIVTTVAFREAARFDVGGSAPEQPWWFLVVRGGDGGVESVAMRTAPFAPHPLWLMPMSDHAARLVGNALVARCEASPGQQIGLNGALDAVRACGAVIEGAGVGPVRELMHLRLFRLGDLVRPTRPEGELRMATLADLDLVHEWFKRFHLDADEQAGRTEAAYDETLTPDDVAARLGTGRFCLWEVDGTSVHLTVASPPAYGVARIGPVFTPYEHRGRGYAGWTVAELSRQLRATGTEPCLFTDQANPVSNRLYESLGYVPVTDTVQLLIG